MDREKSRPPCYTGSRITQPCRQPSPPSARLTASNTRHPSPSPGRVDRPQIRRAQRSYRHLAARRPLLHPLLGQLRHQHRLHPTRRPRRISQQRDLHLRAHGRPPAGHRRPPHRPTPQHRRPLPPRLPVPGRRRHRPLPPRPVLQLPGHRGHRRQPLQPPAVHRHPLQRHCRRHHPRRAPQLDQRNRHRHRDPGARHHDRRRPPTSHTTSPRRRRRPRRSRR